MENHAGVPVSCGCGAGEIAGRCAHPAINAQRTAVSINERTDIDEPRPKVDQLR
jgi:hypothetical protein